MSVLCSLAFPASPCPAQEAGSPGKPVAPVNSLSAGKESYTDKRDRTRVHVHLTSKGGQL